MSEFALAVIVVAVLGVLALAFGFAIVYLNRGSFRGDFKSGRTHAKVDFKGRRGEESKKI